MTLSFYQLKEPPFAASPDPRFLFLSDTHRLALASLLRALQAGHGFVTLVAQPGLGKTTLLFHILRSFGDKVSTIYIFQAVQAPVDLLRAMLADLGVREIDENPEAMLSQLTIKLSEEQRLGRRVVVVIDEAQNLDPFLFKTLGALSNLETPQGRLIQFILCGRPMLSEKLAAINSLQWMKAGEPVARLEPFTAQDTLRYLDHRLRTAGYDRQLPLFTPEAAQLVAGYSQGTPRIINTLCSEALFTAYRHKREQIGADTVREAATTLNLAPPNKESLFARMPQIMTGPPSSIGAPAQAPALAHATGYMSVLPPQRSAPRLQAEVAESVVRIAPSEWPTDTLASPASMKEFVAVPVAVPVASPVASAWSASKERQYLDVPPKNTAPNPVRQFVPSTVEDAKQEGSADAPLTVSPSQASAVEAVIPIHPRAPAPAEEPASWKEANRDNVIPLRPSPPTVPQSPTRNKRSSLWSLVPRPSAGFAASAVLIVFLSGVVFGVYLPKTYHARVAAAPLMPTPVPVVQRNPPPTILAIAPEPPPSEPLTDTKTAVEPSRSEHDLKGMDLQSALQALSTKSQRQ